jgi:hypothetical protein
MDRHIVVLVWELHQFSVQRVRHIKATAEIVPHVTSCFSEWRPLAIRVPEGRFPTMFPSAPGKLMWSNPPATEGVLVVCSDPESPGDCYRTLSWRGFQRSRPRRVANTAIARG